MARGDKAFDAGVRYKSRVNACESIKTRTVTLTDVQRGAFGMSVRQTCQIT